MTKEEKMLKSEIKIQLKNEMWNPTKKCVVLVHSALFQEKNIVVKSRLIAISFKHKLMNVWKKKTRK